LLQSNTNFGIGPFSRNQNVLDIQPVIPVNVSRNWNMIIRRITPIVWQPAPSTANLEVFGIEENTPVYLAAQDVQAHAGVFGFGDMTPTFFFSPAKPHKVIWAAGPMFLCPPPLGGSGARKAEHGAVYGGADATWSVDHRRAGEQHLVGCGAIGSRGRETDVVAVFHQLQPEKGLVHLDVANDHGELAGIKRERLDGAGGRRNGASVPIGISQ
jgi:hypothetical protein